ncbi:MAG: hypothetical protein R3E12_02455 [Candidatus Eisenbacteria bacterium]|uniref:ActD-like protein n=1 Tax=Eiseniibacteriota bacterium TaxID=2212470 RepID=A0A956LX63_UNCEI|nr:hypothetical protein [Candidatus Eisenbacteria bacterium]
MSSRDPHDPLPEIPGWKCERFLLGELDEAEMKRIRDRASRDERLRERLHQLELSNREILAAYPPRQSSRQVRDRLRRAESEGRPSTGGGTRFVLRTLLSPKTLIPIGAVAATVLALLLLPHPNPTEGPPLPEVTRIKGPAAELHLYRKTAESSEELTDGAAAAEHDMVLLEYRTSAPAFGVILSLDGRGTVTHHLPEEGSVAIALEQGGGHFLEHAYELDDAPRWEVFFLVTAPSPFPLDRVERAMRKSWSEAQNFVRSPGVDDSLPALDLPTDLRIVRLTLNKDSSDGQ